MRNFVIGVIVTIIVIVIVILAAFNFGYVPTVADATPPHFERHLMMGAVDAAVDRIAPRANNPVSPTDENLIEGMKIYTMNCSVCHGTLDNKSSPLEKSFYPPVPQIILDPLDDPEWHIFYVIRTGIRYTGMPAWNRVLSEQEMWKVTAFLSRIEKLPPAVQDAWKKAYGVGPQPAAPPEKNDQH